MLSTFPKLLRKILGIDAVENEMLKMQKEALDGMQDRLQEFCLEIIPHILNGGVDPERVPNPGRGFMEKRYIDVRSEAGQKLHDAIEKSGALYVATTKKFATMTDIKNLEFLTNFDVKELIERQLKDPALIQPLVERINACQVKR